MANWCDFHLAVIGPAPSLLVIRNAIESRLVPLGNDEMERAYDCNPDQDHWFLVADNRPMKIERGNLILCGWSKWHPPKAWVQAMSKEHPDTVWKIEYSVEDMWDSAEYEFRNWGWKQLRRSVGYFHTAQEGEPIHHWLVWFERDDIATKVMHGICADCITAGYAIDAYEVGSRCDLVTRNIDASPTTSRSSMGANPTVWPRPWTKTAISDRWRASTTLACN